MVGPREGKLGQVIGKEKKRRTRKIRTIGKRRTPLFKEKIQMDEGGRGNLSPTNLTGGSLGQKKKKWFNIILHNQKLKEGGVPSSRTRKKIELNNKKRGGKEDFISLILEGERAKSKGMRSLMLKLTEWGGPQAKSHRTEERSESEGKGERQNIAFG